MYRKATLAASNPDSREVRSSQIRVSLALDQTYDPLVPGIAKQRAAESLQAEARLSGSIRTVYTMNLGATSRGVRLGL